MNHTVEESPEKITITFHTHKYSDSVAVSMKAFALGDKLNHHATVTTSYNKVVVEVTTHNVGNKVTIKDQEFKKLLLDGL